MDRQKRLVVFRKLRADLPFHQVGDRLRGAVVFSHAQPDILFDGHLERGAAQRGADQAVEAGQEVFAGGGVGVEGPPEAAARPRAPPGL